MCEPVDPVPAVLPSLKFDFENSLVGTPGGTFTATVNGPVSYLSGGPQGTSIDFPGSPTNIYLELLDAPSQDGGTWQHGSTLINQATMV
jgi:hypothetical protein